MLERFCAFLRPWLDEHWVTAEDLGVPQHLIDAVFAELGLEQSYHAAIRRSADPARTLRRVQAGLSTPVPGGLLLGDVIGGYGVAQAKVALLLSSWDLDRLSPRTTGLRLAETTRSAATTPESAPALVIP